MVNAMMNSSATIPVSPTIMLAATTTTAPRADNGVPLNLLTFDNPVFCCYLFWASVLVMKMLLMSLLTVVQRFRNKIAALLPRCCVKKVFPNREDLFFKDIEVEFNDPDVERVRRAHRNDMENILPFFTMALIYICTDPDPILAGILIRIVAIARIAHSLVYAVYPVPQPARAIAFYIAFAVTIYMAGCVALHTIKFI